MAHAHGHAQDMAHAHGHAQDMAHAHGLAQDMAHAHGHAQEMAHGLAQHSAFASCMTLVDSSDVHMRPGSKICRYFSVRGRLVSWTCGRSCTATITERYCSASHTLLLVIIKDAPLHSMFMCVCVCVYVFMYVYVCHSMFECVCMCASVVQMLPRPQ
jgi:hypothetical protein